jgi:hypothetical protein
MTDAPERIWAWYDAEYEVVTGSLREKPHEPSHPYILATPRPMSEAPRDGTKVLAWWEGADGYLTTWWDREAHGFGAWVGTWIGGADGLHFPTHFLPHPEEPK